jgi:hypothetical protein
MRESLPVFPIVPAAGVVLKLRTGQANDVFFREVSPSFFLFSTGVDRWLSLCMLRSL